MNLAMMMNPDMAAMPDDQFRQMQTMTALYGLGGLMRGQDAGGTLSSLMALNMGRHNRQTEAEKKRKQQQERQRILGGIFGNSPRVVGHDPTYGRGGQSPVRLPQPNSPQALASETGAAIGKTAYTPGDKESFTAAMWPHAMRVSQRTGVDPRIVVAQAAQETGWGKHAPNNNFFGIKSHGQPGGATLSTQEFMGGQNQTVQDSFRTYGGMGQSADDYASFLLNNPRYGEMLGAQGLDQQLAALGRSGYATDPNYAQSVGAIARSIGAPQSGGVRTAQAGPITREQVVQVLGSDALSDADKRFVVEEFRNQSKNGMTGKERYMNVDGVLYDVTGDRPVAVTERTPNDSAAQQKVNRIMSAYGVDQKTAVGIADGVLRVSRDPYTDRIQVTNLATNETWTPSARDQQQNQTPQEATPPANEAEQQNLTFGDAYGDAENAFGLEGMFRRGANWASDLVTGQQVYPETGQTQQDFAVLREDITQDMQSAYGQRVPSWALQAIRDLTPEAGTFEGQGAAQNKLRALGRRFQQELEAVEGSLSSRGMSGLSPEDRQALQSQRGGLRRALAKVQNALQGFEGEGVEIRPEVQDRLKAYE